MRNTPKGLSILGIFIVIFTIPLTAFAATVGNPSGTDIPKGSGVFSLKQDKNISLKAAVDFDYIFNRDLHANAAVRTKIKNGTWSMVKISYGMLNDRIEPYLAFGVVSLKAKWNEAGTDVELKSDNTLGWGIGTRALLYSLQKPKVNFIGNVMYRMANLDPSEGSVNGSKVGLDNSKSKFLIREWQLALLASTEIDIGGEGSDREEILGISKLVPYAGIKYSDINGRLRLQRSNATFYNPGTIEAEHNFGIFAGCDILGTGSLSLNIEGRFIDETALTGGLALLF